MNLINRQVAVTNISNMHGNVPTEYDKKYIEKALNRVVKIVDFDGGFYLTDFFIKEFVKENNDYIHYGFLKLDRGNFKLLED